MYWFVQHNSQGLGSRALGRGNKIIFACSGDTSVARMEKGRAPRQKTRRERGDQGRRKMQGEDEERLAFRGVSEKKKDVENEREEKKGREKEKEQRRVEATR